MRGLKMVDVLQVPALVITGMFVQGARFSSLEAFGAGIYDSSAPSPSTGQVPLSHQDLQTYLDRIRLEMGSRNRKTAAMVFQAHLEEKLHSVETGMTIVALPAQDQNLVKAFTVAEKLLSKQTFDCVLMLEEQQPGGILFGLSLSSESSANGSGSLTIATLSGGTIASRTGNGFSQIDQLIGEVL